MSGKLVRANGNFQYQIHRRSASAVPKRPLATSSNATPAKLQSTATPAPGLLAGIRHRGNLLRNVLSIAMASSIPPSSIPPADPDVPEKMIQEAEADAKAYITNLSRKKGYWRTPVGGWKAKTLIYAASAAASAGLAFISSTNAASWAIVSRVGLGSLGAWGSIALNAIAGGLVIGSTIYLIVKGLINRSRGKKLIASKSALQALVNDDQMRRALALALNGLESTEQRNAALVIFEPKQRTQIENRMEIEGSVEYVADFRSALENEEAIDSDIYNEAEVDNRIKALQDINKKLPVIKELRQMKKDLKAIMDAVGYVVEYQEKDDKDSLDPDKYNLAVIDKTIAALARLGDNIIVYIADEEKNLVEALQAMNEALKKIHLTAQEIEDAERILKIDFKAYGNTEDDLAKAAGNLATLNLISEKMAKSKRKTAQEESLASRVKDAVSTLGAKIADIKKALELVELEGKDGRYTLESPIGKGGMGHVWKGEKIGTKDLLAIKEMAVEKLIADLKEAYRNVDAKVIEHAGQFLARFAQEFTLGRVLQHAGLCATIDTNIDIVLPGILGNGTLPLEKIDDPKEFKVFYSKLEEKIRAFLKRFSSQDLEKVQGRRIFMATEFVPKSPGSKERAPNLREEISKLAKLGGTMNTTRVRELFKPLFEALEYLHRFGVYHRDIKPANLVITKDGKGNDRLKVIDLGIAKVASPSEDMTSFKEVIGSEGYEAPTDYQMAGKLNNDNYERSDIYSLAIVLIEALTGKNPLSELEEKSDRSNYYSDREGFTTEFLKELGVPAELIPSLQKATSPKHAENYRSIKGFGEAFFAETSADEKKKGADTAAESPKGKRAPRPAGPPPLEKEEDEPAVKMPDELAPVSAESIDEAKLDAALDHYNNEGVELTEEQMLMFEQRLSVLLRNKSISNDLKAKIREAKFTLMAIMDEEE